MAHYETRITKNDLGQIVATRYFVNDWLGDTRLVEHVHTRIFTEAGYRVETGVGILGDAYIQFIPTVPIGRRRG